MKNIAFFTSNSLIYFLFFLGFNLKVYAQSFNNSVDSQSNPNQEQKLDNQQQNASAINQTGVYNIGEAATYKIQGLGGRQVVCPRPSIIFGASYNNFGGSDFPDNSSYGLNGALVVPLGGKIGKNCQKMAETISRKTQYDLEIINARACAELLKAGIQLNPENFPTLSGVCDGVSVKTINKHTPERSFRSEAKRSNQSEQNEQTQKEN